ncbi:MAG: holo-ACP synthase [Planctomycetota bacterium]
MIIGLGTDIVEISRIRSMVERHGDHFVDRCFTAREIEYAQKHRDSVVRLAGRWAAKEAVVKVLGTGFVNGITFHDVEVVSLHTGQPTVKLGGEAAEIALRLGITEVKLTISHARDYATATAIGLGIPEVT